MTADQELEKRMWSGDGHPFAMPSRERPTDRAEFDAVRDLGVLGRELRAARLTIGLTMGQVGRAAGVSGQQVSRLEHGLLRRFDAVTLSRAMAAVGLVLSMRVFPAGVPIRDAGHAGLLDRIRKRLGSAWRWHLEVPVRGEPDRRAWDATAVLGRLRVAFEAETRLYDVQAQVRQIMAKFGMATPSESSWWSPTLATTGPCWPRYESYCGRTSPSTRSP